MNLFARFQFLKRGLNFFYEGGHNGILPQRFVIPQGTFPSMSNVEEMRCGVMGDKKLGRSSEGGLLKFADYTC